MPLNAKNPVLLLLIGLPVATLAAGVATLALIGRGGLDTVGDPVRRTAQVQQVDLAADAAARQPEGRRLAKSGLRRGGGLAGVPGPGRRDLAPRGALAARRTGDRARPRSGQR